MLYLFNKTNKDMSNYRLEKTENKFENITKFYIIETEIIDNKKYSDIIYEFDNINQATSKLNLLQALEYNKSGL